MALHPGPNHVHPCCEERRVFPLTSTLVANEPCLETRANLLESDVRLLIKLTWNSPTGQRNPASEFQNGRYFIA